MPSASPDAIQPPPLIDSVTLTIPKDRRFYGVVRLLVGGLAARLGLAYEQMDDLQLAVESVLPAHAHDGEAITLNAAVEEQRVELWVGPLDGPALDARLADSEGSIGLERLLATLVEEAELIEREDGRWLRLEKRIPLRTK